MSLLDLLGEPEWAKSIKSDLDKLATMQANLDKVAMAQANLLVTANAVQNHITQLGELIMSTFAEVKQAWVDFATGLKT